MRCDSHDVQPAGGRFARAEKHGAHGNRVRDTVVAFSLANLAFLRVWSEGSYAARDTFWMRNPPEPILLVAAMLNVLIVGTLLSVGTYVVRANSNVPLRVFSRWAFLLVMLVPLNAARHVLSQRVPYFDFLRTQPLLEYLGAHGLQLLAVVSVIVTAFLMRQFSAAMARTAYSVLLILFPFLLVTFSQGLYAIAAYDNSAFLDRPLAPSMPQAAKRRVVWIVFDELDSRLAFIDRPPDIDMPHFDRLRSESLFAAQAFPPGPDTAHSVPSFTLARTVTGYRALAPDRLDLEIEGSCPKVSWGEPANIFRRARHAGLRTAVVGWYLPYCRVLTADLDHCAWWPAPRYYNSMGDTLGGIMLNMARSLFETNVYSPFGQSVHSRHSARQIPEILAAAYAAAGNPDLGFVFLHLPVPHGPHLYDPTSGTLSGKGWSVADYRNSLVLADKSLGELRTLLESSGLWDSTILLVTSDHPLRQSRLVDGKQDDRVPFLLKLPGESTPRIFEKPFSAVLAGEILLEAAKQEMDQARVMEWLENRTGGPASPANSGETFHH